MLDLDLGEETPLWKCTANISVVVEKIKDLDIPVDGRIASYCTPVYVRRCPGSLFGQDVC